MMGINNHSHTQTISYGNTWITINHQKYFINVLKFSEFLIVVYNYIIGGNIPTIVYMFKVNKGDDNTSIQV